MSNRIYNDLREWAKTRPSLRRSAIENLRFDAVGFDNDDPPFGGEYSDFEQADNRAAARAFRLAAQILDRLADAYARPEDIAVELRDQGIANDAELGAPRGPQAAGQGS